MNVTPSFMILRNHVTIDHAEEVPAATVFLHKHAIKQGGVCLLTTPCQSAATCVLSSGNNTQLM